MKVRFSLVLFVVLSLMTVNNFGQELTLTTTAANTVSSKSSIDLPGLTNNPLAIIVATPTGNTELLNTNPIGAWYYSGKWNIFNSNHSVMPLGATYMIQFVLQPGPNQFMHQVTKENLGAEGSYIDNPALNNKPGAQFKILQNYAPEVRSPYNLNRFKSKTDYSTAAGRWYIANVNGEPLAPNTVFNIIINTGGPNPAPTPGPTPVSTPPRLPVVTPTPLPVYSPTPIPISRDTPRPVLDPTPIPRITPVPLPVSTPRTPPTPTPVPAATPIRLNGFVDMHTHPMSHLGFGKKLLHGAPDAGSLIPAGTKNCNPFDLRASSINDALGNGSSTHGGWGTNNLCGDYVRAAVISNLLDKDFAFRVSGNIHGDHRHEGIDSSPEFLYAPNQTSKVHQQMWWEWIERAHKEGKLNVIVALAVNNELLAEVINGDAPKDDKNSADLQIDEIISFVGRHDFMQIAKTPADLRRIVGEGGLAVILGMEVDNIGNFNKLGMAVNETTVKNEINRLYSKGVRYIFPIHLLDNKFGGTAVYSNLFNAANKYSTGSFYTVKTGPVGFKLGVSPAVGGDFSVMQSFAPTLDALSGIPYPPAMQADPFKPGFCPVPILGCWQTFKTIRSIFTPDPSYLIYSTIPGGHVNTKGLTNIGKFAVLEMMKLGMLIDIDHMSDKSQADTLDIAERFNNNYPVNIGHNGIRKPSGSERHASETNVERVAKLGGVFGVGTSDSEEHHSDAETFISSFNEVWSIMARNGGSPRVAMGTDVNGMERLPRASTNLDSVKFYSADFYDDIPNNLEDNFKKCKTGSREWDYTTEGVAHYGLIADFIRDIRKRNVSVQQRLMDSAEYFAQMWEKVDMQKTAVR